MASQELGVRGQAPLRRPHPRPIPTHSNLRGPEKPKKPRKRSNRLIPVLGLEPADPTEAHSRPAAACAAQPETERSVGPPAGRQACDPARCRKRTISTTRAGRIAPSRAAGQARGRWAGARDLPLPGAPASSADPFPPASRCRRGFEVVRPRGTGRRRRQGAVSAQPRPPASSAFEFPGRGCRDFAPSSSGVSYPQRSPDRSLGRLCGLRGGGSVRARETRGSLAGGGVWSCK